MTPETMGTYMLLVRVLATSAKARQMTEEKAMDLHIVDLRLSAAKANMRSLEATRNSMSKFERLLEDSPCYIYHLIGTLWEGNPTFFDSMTKSSRNQLTVISLL